MSKITPSRGYLLRALYEWLLDNDLTPHLAVMAEVPGTQVPLAYVNDGQITLNIAPGAVRDLLIDNEALSFSARFGGQPMQVYVPMAAVAAIFSRETGAGMGFGMEPGAEQLNAQIEAQLAALNESDDQEVSEEVESAQKADAKASKRPALKVVK